MPRITPSTSLPLLIKTTTHPWQWKNFTIASSNQIDLDSTYSKVVVDTWFALVASGLVQLYKVTSVASVARSAFGISAKITRLAADYSDPKISTFFPLQTTSVLAQSEELTIARQPLDHPLYGAVLDIDALRPDLVGAQAIAITGKAQKLSVNTSASTLAFHPDDGTPALKLKPGDIVTLIDPGPLPINTDSSIPDWSGSTVARKLRVSDATDAPALSKPRSPPSPSRRPPKTTPTSRSSLSSPPSSPSANHTRIRKSSSRIR